MSDLRYRAAVLGDVPQLARIRTTEWETEPYWTRRIGRYLNGEITAQKALNTGVIYVAEDGAAIAGFIAGHLTRRFGCDGELQWINVAREYRRRGISSGLMRVLAHWFVEQNALRVCVDPDDRAFYIHHGAESLNRRWLYWPDIRILLEQPGTAPVR
jgi:GNAT superfamily N-acetyltransferase